MAEKQRELLEWLTPDGKLNLDSGRGQALQKLADNLRSEFPRRNSTSFKDVAPGSYMRGVVQLLAIGMISLDSLLEQVPTAILERHVNDWIFDLRPHNENDEEEVRAAHQLNGENDLELLLAVSLLVTLQRESERQR